MADFSFNKISKNCKRIQTKYRVISTDIPVPESLPQLEELMKIESRSMHGAYPMIWKSANNFQVEDYWGNKWLDFTSTIFVANAGHANEEVKKAIIDIVSKNLLAAYNYPTLERISFIKFLIENTPDFIEKAFLLSAGTETTEVALKLMRMWGQNIVPNKQAIICFDGNWHGRTLGAQFMAGNKSQKEWVGFKDPLTYHLPFPYDNERSFKDDFYKMCLNNNLDPDSDIAGIMMETYQGWGAYFYPDNYIKELVEIQKKHNILVSFDEMQSGFGRTGKLFGYMHYDIEPDIICCGKGASSSLPLSMVLGRSELLDLPDVGSMSSTHSAHPIVCAAGEANLKYILDNRLVEKSEELGQILKNKLLDLSVELKEKITIEINCRGLVAGVIIKGLNNVPASQLCSQISEKCFQNGLLVVHTGRESIKIAPPLTITQDALLDGILVFSEIVKELVEK
jgi:4-aminobutyrate aminotransferase / (S)-3-amino-2-methylpropionate transaminase / 5-aminovalerate transaminase